MPLSIPRDAPVMLIRRSAFERTALSRAAFDARFNLTPDEFRVEGELIAVGPLFAEGAVEALTDALEEAGLRYFDDFFDLSGNWPEWVQVFARSADR